MSNLRYTVLVFVCCGLCLLFLPVVLFLLVVLLARTAPSSDLSFVLMLASLAAWVPSVLMGLPVLGAGMAIWRYPGLWKLLISVLLLGLYVACIVYFLPLTLQIIGALGFSFGPT